MSRVSVQRYLSQGGNHRVDCCIGSRAMLPTDAETARLLAGLEVALAAALREAGRGKCLKCGHEWETAIWVQPWDVCHCDYCGGVLVPVKGRQP
jgi:hypothetical protein